MYYLQFILVLKLINEIMVNIDFIAAAMKSHQEYRAVILNNLLFGSVKATEGGWDPARVLYIFNLLFSLKYIQSWKQTKWLEIRVKTKVLEKRSYFHRFYAYLEMRDNDNIRQAEIAKKLLKEQSAIMTEEEKIRYKKAILKEERQAS